MPRSARIIVAGYPHHIIQRGHNQGVVFASDEDYLYYFDNLKEWKKKLGCKVYAYCLLTNHVHLIVDPGEEEKNVAYLIKRLAGRQTRYVNKLARGFVYLAAVIDWYSRKVLAWRLSNTIDSEFCVDCLEQSLRSYGTPEIFNTDQGCQFTSDAFTGVLNLHGIAISMDGRGRALDNIFVE